MKGEKTRNMDKDMEEMEIRRAINEIKRQGMNFAYCPSCHDYRLFSGAYKKSEASEMFCHCLYPDCEREVSLEYVNNRLVQEASRKGWLKYSRERAGQEKKPEARADEQQFSLVQYFRERRRLAVEEIPADKKPQIKNLSEKLQDSPRERNLKIRDSGGNPLA